MVRVQNLSKILNFSTIISFFLKRFLLAFGKYFKSVTVVWNLSHTLMQTEHFLLIIGCSIYGGGKKCVFFSLLLEIKVLPFDFVSNTFCVRSPLLRLVDNNNGHSHQHKDVEIWMSNMQRQILTTFLVYRLFSGTYSTKTIQCTSKKKSCVV